MTYKVNSHLEVHSGNQVLNITDFTFPNSATLSSEQILDQFVHSNHFSFDCLPDVVKSAPPDNLYLRQAFDPDKISVQDFRKYNRAQADTFLNDFLNDPNWKNDKKDFVVLFDKYFQIQEAQEDCEYYVINMDWFDENDERLREPEHEIYDYYFLIIYINQNSCILSVNEWFYD